ncbi:MAG: DNA polymerase/3'-5' exonuclease PolX [Patescibacteria group bacterium]|jgi:DNA polymerase (family 10)
MKETISNKDLVVLLKEIVAAMEVKEYSFFIIRAYQNAISAIEALTMNVVDLWEDERLNTIPGIGPSISQHLSDYFETGVYPEYDEIIKDLPDGMFGLIGLRGIGAKRAYKLAQAFELTSRASALEKIKKAAESHKIMELEGFGEKLEQQILESITDMKKTKNEKTRLLLVHAEEIAKRVIDYMNTSPHVLNIEAMGSLRRREATVGDLDMVVATEEPEKSLAHFMKFPEIGEVLAEGDKKLSVNLKNNAQVDIRVIEPKTFGSMVQYFTGSKQHNIVLRTYALSKKMSLSEYGIKHKGELHEFATEEAFYNYLGLDLIPPELRQAKNEVDLAKSHQLPDLIKASDIKGDMHMHTIASDGLNTIGEMVKACEELGYEYMGIADHAPSVQSRGEDEVRMMIEKQRTAVDEINKVSNIKVLLGYEVNILADTSLSLPIEFLEMLDYVIAGIHSGFNESREQITNRLIAAARNPFVTFISHPTGRLLNERDAYEVDWDEFFNVVKENGKVLEINSYPDRLDLPDDLVYEAQTRGIKMIINTDAHEISHLNLMRYGADVARRGWCTKKDIVNTLPLDNFKEALKIK